MSPYKNRRHRKMVAGLYSRFNFCVYCESIANCGDHIPPIFWYLELGPSYFHENKIQLMIVPACIRCNNLLGKRKLLSLEERKAFIHRFLENS